MRRCEWWVVASLTAALAAPVLANGPRTEPLFRIERSKNANVVQYDARLRGDGRLDPEQPVVGYWIRLAEDGRREELSWIQRRFAYGFTARTDRDTDRAVLEMAADIGRKLIVYRQGGVYRAETRIDGRPAFLEKLFVQSIEGGWRPKVEYIDLFGTDVETGEVRSERFVPD